MGVHPQRDRLVAVPQLFRHAGNIRPGCNSHAGEGVPQLVGVQVWNAVALREVLHIPHGAMGVHRFGAAVLGEYKGADGRLCLLLPQRPQQGDNLRVNVYYAGASVFRRVQVDALLGRIAEIAADGDGTLLKVNVPPLEAAAFAPPDAGVDQQPEKDLPFQRLFFETVQNIPHFPGGIGFDFLPLYFVLPGLWALHLVHRIAGDHVGQIGHFEEAGEDHIALDHRAVRLALGLQLQQQGGHVGGGNVRQLLLPQRRVNPAIEAALIAATAILRQRDRLGGHEYPLPELVKGLDFRRLCGLLGFLLAFLFPTDHFPGLALPLKFGGDFC